MRWFKLVPPAAILAGVVLLFVVAPGDALAGALV